MDLDFFWISTARRMLATEPSWDTPFQVMEIDSDIEIEIIGIDIKIAIWLFLPLHQEWTSTRAGKTLTCCREAPSMPWLQGETDLKKKKHLNKIEEFFTTQVMMFGKKK